MKPLRLLPLAGCVLALACAPALAGPGPDAAGAAPTQRVVLPTTASPEHYRIDITPDATARTFSGTVDIDFVEHTPSQTVELNGADLVIDRAAIGGEPAAPAVRYDPAAQTITFTLGHPLAAGPHTLHVEYHGKIYEQSSGLFSLDYETPGGKARALFTQFENSDARRFVPCWDEPGLKATFALSATVPAALMPLSNMPVESTQALPGGLVHVHFGTTPKMSSYLLFFGLGDFERLHRMVDGVDVGVVVKRGDLANAAYALDAAANILGFYNGYFGTPYPLPKLDMIAGPGASQFFGAMENWGAIFYFERILLVDPRVSTEADKQRVYTVVAHEMAHQWFGDLVTMAWWDDLWLNEGFASWMQNKVTDHFHPEWKVWLRSQGDKQVAMGEDARDGTHPIITPIFDVQQASGAFDDITYRKGAAVIRTLESYLGEDAFRAGVRRYMHDHAYGNTVTDDLWAEMDRDSAHPITRIAHDLTQQAGVPMISEASSKCVGGKTEIALVQGHFAIDADSTAARLWHVPLTVATTGGGSAKAVISGTTPTTVTVAGCDPVILNAGQTTYMRSRYSDQGLAAIATHFGELSPDDQLGLLSDTGSLAYVGLLPMSAFMNLTRALPAQADVVVLSELVDRLSSLDHLYQDLPQQAAFRSYARSVLAPVFARVGWDKVPGESDNTGVLRSDLIPVLGEFGDPAVLAEARKRFDRFRADPASLDAGTRRAVLRVVAVHADAATWDQLHAMAKSAKTQVERQELYTLLGIAQDPALAQKAMELALTGEPPKTTAPGMIGVVSRRHAAMAFNFAVAHWGQLESYIEPTSTARYVPRLVGGASDLALIDKVEAFAAAHIPAGARQDLRKATASIRYSASIRKDRLPEVDAWLQARGA
jgi:aminopeptidase N